MRSNLRLLTAIFSIVCLVFSCSDDETTPTPVVPVTENPTTTEATPTIVSSVNWLSFDPTLKNQLSPVKQIVINPDKITTDINVTITAGFEMSLDNVTFVDSAIIPSASVNDEKVIYVRFLPTEALMYNGTITFQSSDLASNKVINLNGEGLVIKHNYTTFSNQSLGFGGGFSQNASQIFTLHNDLSNIETIKMYLQIDCPGSGCDDWDRYADIKVKDVASGNWYELGRYITPYWTGTQQLDRGLEFDVTDFKSLLSGNVELRIFIENWTSKADIISVDFDFIEGTPDYTYSAISEVMQYNNSSAAGVPYGVAHNFDLTRAITIPSNSEETKLRTIISGWGHATPNDADGRGCAEWCFRTHDVKINGANMFSHNLGPLGCASNPVSNQSPGNMAT